MTREIFQEIRQLLMNHLDTGRELEDGEILEKIDEVIMKYSREHYLSLDDRMNLRQELFYSIRKLDVLQELIEDNSVTEIMVNGEENIFVERNGHLGRWEKSFTSREKLEDVIQQIVGSCNRVVNESMPIVDARLPNGARVNVVIPPVALDGPIMTIRRFPDDPITMEHLIQLGSVTGECALFLKKLVEARYSIIIGGGTSSGKTTFLSALAAFIPGDERIITIEDNAELQIFGVENLVRMEAKMANMEGNREITIRDLIKTSLRMRPDRIIVGEVRGEEASDLLTSFNTGHEGGIATLHSNSCKDTVSRLETMVLMGMEIPLDAIRRQIASGVDILVHLGRLKDKSRKLLEVSEIIGYKDGEVQLQSLFVYGRQGLQKVNPLYHREKLERAGMTI
jgi:pilus assembly protein CpaF